MSLHKKNYTRRALITENVVKTRKRPIINPNNYLSTAESQLLVHPKGARVMDSRSSIGGKGFCSLFTGFACEKGMYDKSAPHGTLNFGSNSIQKILNDKLDTIYKHIKLDANFAADIKVLLNSAAQKTYVNYKTNLCIINIHIDTKNKIFTYSIPNKKDLPRDSRIAGIEYLFENIIKWCKRESGKQNIIKVNTGVTPNVSGINLKTAIFIWCSDRHIWEVPDIDKKIPICLYACPRDKKYIVIPDGTFLIQSTTRRYASKGLNWEEQKKLFTYDIKTKKKMFFRGADTTRYIHNIRGYIYDRLKTEPDLKFKNDVLYEFLTAQNYESVAAFKKYKFMLNLPGNYPWSTRLKYLYLGRQFIINIRVFTYLDDGSVEDHYHSFVDYIIPQDTYCINIDMKYYYVNLKNELDELKKKHIALNNAECDRVYKMIKNIYYKYQNKEPSMDKQVQHAYKLVNDLSTVDIYTYYLQIAMRNQSLGINHINM